MSCKRLLFSSQPPLATSRGKIAHYTQMRMDIGWASSLLLVGHKLLRILFRRWQSSAEPTSNNLGACFAHPSAAHRCDSPPPAMRSLSRCVVSITRLNMRAAHYLNSHTALARTQTPHIPVLPTQRRFSGGSLYAKHRRHKPCRRNLFTCCCSHSMACLRPFRSKEK